MRVRLPGMLLPTIAIAACASGSQATTTSSTTGTPVLTSPETTPTLTPSTTVAASTVAGSPTTSADSAIQVVVEVREGDVEGGGRIEVPLGSEVVLSVTSDVADEVHVHGYDLFFDVEAGVSTSFRFTADVPGIFEAELEGSHLGIATLVVGP